MLKAQVSCCNPWGTVLAVFATSQHAMMHTLLPLAMLAACATWDNPQILQAGITHLVHISSNPNHSRELHGASPKPVNAATAVCMLAGRHLRQPMADRSHAATVGCISAALRMGNACCGFSIGLSSTDLHDEPQLRPLTRCREETRSKCGLCSFHLCCHSLDRHTRRMFQAGTSLWYHPTRNQPQTCY